MYKCIEVDGICTKKRDGKSNATLNEFYAIAIKILYNHE